MLLTLRIFIYFFHHPLIFPTIISQIDLLMLLSTVFFVEIFPTVYPSVYCSVLVTVSSISSFSYLFARSFLIPVHVHQSSYLAPYLWFVPRFHSQTVFSEYIFGVLSLGYDIWPHMANGQPQCKRFCPKNYDLNNFK